MSGVIVVIGASSAGLYAAELLAKGGKKVVLLERSASISPRERTYIITPRLLEVVPDIAPELIRHRIERIQVQAGQYQAEIKLSSPDLVLDRKELITELARRAESAGVELRLGHEFEGIKVQDGKTKLKVTTESETYLLTPKILIGADGVNSEVIEHLPAAQVESVPLVQTVVDLPANWDERVTKVWFEPEDTPYFYWLIPDQGRKGVVGLISEKRADIRGLLNSFLERQGIQPGEYQAGEAALHQKGIQTRYQVGNLHVHLVGDAAGQVKVTTVGGTVTGLAAASSLAESILDDRKVTHSQRGLNQELDLHLFIRSLLNKMSPEDYHDLIKSITPQVESFLSERDRDSMRSHFWKLAVLQPGFIPMGLKLLFRQMVIR